MPGARFAYLSACATYQARRQFLMWPSRWVRPCASPVPDVVAALWPVAGEHTADFARRMYNHLVTFEEGMPVLHPENSAHALRETAYALRDAHPDQPERWAAFVCAASR